jgi:multidrug efflux pump subunit AcrA (membrane-fusion protein)
MNRKYFYIILSVVVFCVILIYIVMLQTSRIKPPDEKVIPHPEAPYKSYISGVGIVEPSSENIFLSAQPGRLIDKVLVTVGAKVKKNEILFRLEDRDLEAELEMRQASYENSIANLQKLESLPRIEDLSSAEAVFKSAGVQLSEAKLQYEMVQGLGDKRAISKDEINRRRFGYEQALAKWEQAQAELEKIKAGTWKPDLEIARLQVKQSKASVDQVKTEIQRTIIRSPIDGTVLQIKIHEGEFPSSGTSAMIVGNTEEMNLRVNINQFDAPYFRPDNPATAFLQGDSHLKFPLEFIRLDPYLVNKQDLTNDVMDQVDTRVLQVIYRIVKNSDHQIFVGQLMDVFIKAQYSQPFSKLMDKALKKTGLKMIFSKKVNVLHSQEDTIETHPPLQE